MTNDSIPPVWDKTLSERYRGKIANGIRKVPGGAWAVGLGALGYLGSGWFNKFSDRVVEQLTPGIDSVNTVIGQTNAPDHVDLATKLSVDPVIGIPAAIGAYAGYSLKSLNHWVPLASMLAVPAYHLVVDWTQRPSRADNPTNGYDLTDIVSDSWKPAVAFALIYAATRGIRKFKERKKPAPATT